MQDLNAGQLSIKASTPPGGAAAPLQLRLRGRSSDRHPEHILGPYFASALTAAAEQEMGLELHFEELDYFNSSTITSLIQLIQEARAKGIKLTYVYDPALRWQKLSFDALRVFVGDGLDLKQV
jgi:hypothetical protein